MSATLAEFDSRGMSGARPEAGRPSVGECAERARARLFCRAVEDAGLARDPSHASDDAVDEIVALRRADEVARRLAALAAAGRDAGPPDPASVSPA